MKKLLKRFILFLAILALLYGACKLIIIAYESYGFVPRDPYTVMQTKDSITIKWQTNKFENDVLEYGLSIDNLNNKINETKKAKKHSITIKGLNECTKYHYRILSSSLYIDNVDRSFKTLCQSAKSQKIWVIGDSGKVGKEQSEVYKQLLKNIENDFNKLDMWLLLGNSVYSSGTQKQYNKALFEPYKELVKRFVPWAVRGSQDAKRWAFYNIFDFPTKGESGGVPSNDVSFYSIDNGNLHLVMLDSEIRRMDVNSDIVKWLKKDLSENKKPWVIVAIHTPPYTSNGHDSNDDSDGNDRMKKIRENLVPIFDEYSVDLVLSAHSHDYERSKLIINHTGNSATFSNSNIVQNTRKFYTKPLKRTANSGTVYQVCGSSSKLDRANLNHPAMPYHLEMFGSLIIDITPTTLTSQFISIEGNILDKFTITKTNNISE